MKRLVSRAEFARLAGVTAMAISKACAAGGKLAAAGDGKRIDQDHPAALAYLRGKGVAPTKVRKQPPKATPAPTAVRPEADDDGDAEPEERRRPDVDGMAPADARAYLIELNKGLHIRDLPGMSLQRLVERYGTVTAFKDWLDARKKIADIIEKDLRNDETTGRLIERELVKTHVFAAIEQGNKRLLQDAAPNIARTVYAAARRGAPVEEAENDAREVISKILHPIKDSAARALRGGRAKPE